MTTPGNTPPAAAPRLDGLDGYGLDGLDGLDKEAMRRKYAEERAKRLRPDGIAQYHHLTSDMADDPWTPRTERAPVTDHVTFTFIGAGLAGLLTGAELKRSGVHDVRLVDAAGDVGGTWYWNRYPGVMCDTHALVYLPLLEETGHVPTERYAHGPEILGHCQRIARHYGLYDNALFHTKVNEVRWLEDDRCWLVRTARGDRFTTSYLGMGLGPMDVPKLPGVPGIQRFAGRSFHTSRWDYGYTGGDPGGAPMDGLRDKRVAVIGTGASAIQCIPPVARDAREVYVFQRTPSSVHKRDNGPIDPEWFQAVSATPGWQGRLVDGCIADWEGVFGRSAPDVPEEYRLDDGFCLIGRRMRAAVRSVPPDVFSLERVVAAMEDADFEMMEERRRRIDSVVTDPATAEKLKPWYRLLCKRPGYHDEYLQAFNRPNTHLVDTDGKGVERITEHGVVACGTEYEVDCIIYASGFRVAYDASRTGQYEIVGRDGLTLSKAWANGVRTLHGIHVHGFPNLFAVQLVQGAFFPLNLTSAWHDSARTISAVVSHSIERGHHAVSPTEAAQQAWVQMHLRFGTPGYAGDCTPGYLNDEGRAIAQEDALRGGYPFGTAAFLRHIGKWRNSGRFDGLEFQ
jgi:cation diffusion facilitator CzcD-associated flavoprotein CzcO